MDEIQAVLVKAGRKDLALEYYRKIATEFPSQEALKKYLSEHPDANPSNHSVKKEAPEKLDTKKEELKKKLKDFTPSTGKKKRQIDMLTDTTSKNIHNYNDELESGKSTAKDLAEDMIGKDSFEGYPKFSPENKKEILHKLKKKLKEKGLKDEHIKDIADVMDKKMKEHN